MICCDGKLYTLSSPAAKVSGKTTHGTGCTLSSALAAGLAFGMDWQQAVAEAKSFVFGSLCEAVNLSGSISQMYPPSEDCLNRIRLEPWKDK
jgi:hydroxymethylpyrimidine/phosphomethylpyrimidine kinase